MITVVFLSIAAYGLGSNMPSTVWHSRPESITLTYPPGSSVKTLFFLINSETSVVGQISAESGGGWTALGYLSSDGYYRWVAKDLDVITSSLKIDFYVKGDVYEVVAVDTSGATIPVTGVNASDPADHDVSHLVDEQSFFEYPPTVRDQPYFDEIYFVRAAQEYLGMREPTHEWTHPPLGKLIEAAGIAAFSFSPFGWRLIGVLFAALMIPVIYFAGLKMYRSKFAAAASAYLLATDFMHFTMGRLGTVDTFLVFFSVVSLVFFWANFEGMMAGRGPSPRNIFLGVIFASLAISVKWTSAFAVFGQVALMVFASLYTPAGRSALVKVRSMIKPLALTLVSFLAGGVVYLSTYLPYLMIGHTLSDVYSLQWSMLDFHETLPPSHPFASVWATWPLILRPIRLTLDYLPNGLVSTISAMGNPLLWWLGLAAVIVATIKGIQERKPVLIFLVAVYLSQILPYAFVSRDTFIYHYYPEVPVLALLVAGLLDEFWAERGSRKYILIYLAAVGVAFALYYPAISGLPVLPSYVQHLRLMRAWDFLGV